jgi:hypothetical protein
MLQTQGTREMVIQKTWHLNQDHSLILGFLIYKPELTVTPARLLLRINLDNDGAGFRIPNN